MGLEPVWIVSLHSSDDSQFKMARFLARYNYTHVMSVTLRLVGTIQIDYLFLIHMVGRGEFFIMKE